MATTQSIITFLPQGLSGQVVGEIENQGDQASFSLSAASGQYMVVNIMPVTPQFMTAGTVVFPGGGQTGGPGGVIMNQSLTETGIYTINVSANHMSSQVLTGTFVLEVIILPDWILGKSAKQ